MCHCRNTGVERILNKSQHTKLTLEKKIILQLLPGIELLTFRWRVWRSFQQAIPAPASAYGFVVHRRPSDYSFSKQETWNCNGLTWRRPQCRDGQSTGSDPDARSEGTVQQTLVCGNWSSGSEGQGTWQTTCSRCLHWSVPPELPEDTDPKSQMPEESANQYSLA